VKRALYRLLNSFWCCKVNHRIERTALENPVDITLLRNINLMEGDGLAEDHAQTIEHGRLRIRVVVQQYDIVTGLDERNCRVTADVAGSPCQQYLHYRLLSP
jgi:hypothetical protein